MNGTLTEEVSRSTAMAHSAGAPALISAALDFITLFICIELLLLYRHQLSLLLTPVTLSQVDALSDQHRWIMCEHFI